MAEAVQETHVPPRAYKKAVPKEKEKEKKEESGRASASA